MKGPSRPHRRVESAFPAPSFLPGKVSALSAFVAPFKHLNPGATHTEDEDNLSKLFPVPGEWGLLA